MIKQLGILVLCLLCCYFLVFEFLVPLYYSIFRSIFRYYRAAVDTRDWRGIHFFGLLSRLLALPLYFSLLRCYLAADFSEALKIRNHDLLDALLQVDKSLMNDRFLANRSAFHWAAYEGDLEAVRIMLKYGADPNGKHAVNRTSSTCHSRTCTPLYLAVYRGRIAIARMLLTNGADPNGTSSEDIPSHEAASGFDPCRTLGLTNPAVIVFVRWLLEHDADPNKTHGLTTPLDTAVSSGNTEIVRLLLEHGADPNEKASGVANKTYGFIAPLYKAVSRGYTEIVGLLLEHGADPNEQNGSGVANKAQGFVPLYTAVSRGYTEIVRLLLKHDADPNKTRGFITPLDTAISSGNTEIVRLLLEHGADPNKTRDLTTPLYTAVSSGNTEIVRLLLEHGADPNEKASGVANKTYGLITPLYKAVSSCNIEIVRLLLGYGADPNETGIGVASTDDYPRPAKYSVVQPGATDVHLSVLCETPLLLACCRNSKTSGVLRTESSATSASGVLRTGSSANLTCWLPCSSSSSRATSGVLRTERSATSTRWLSCSSSSSSATSGVLRRGTEDNETEGFGPDYAAIVQLLLESGANPNLPMAWNYGGYFPLHIAWKNGSFSTARLLLKYGAHVDAQDSNGDTVLMLAVQQDQVDFVSALLDRGADMNILNRNSTSPFLLACERFPRARILFIGKQQSIALDIIYRLIRQSPHHARPQPRSFTTDDQSNRVDGVLDFAESFFSSFMFAMASSKKSFKFKAS